MYRDEAVNYLKELLKQCESLSPESVFFENPKETDSAGFRVHIKGAIHESERQMVREVAKKYCLQVLEDEDGFVIYKPTK
jgi:DNA invertase Pin-like site-specific DNA recombinase